MSLMKRMFIGLAPLLIVFALSFTDIVAQELEWVATAENSDFLTISDVEVDSKGNTYIAGAFRDDIRLSKSLAFTASGGFDAFIAKFSASGKPIWCKRWGYIENDYGGNVALDSFGNIYVAGIFRNQVDFSGTKLTSTGTSQDIFICKLDTAGKLIYAKQIAGQQLNLSGIRTDSKGNLIIFGDFLGATDFDPSTGKKEYTPWGFSDGFLCVWDKDANWITTTYLGGTGMDRILDVHIDDNGIIYFVGTFSASMRWESNSFTAKGTTNGIIGRYYYNGREWVSNAWYLESYDVVIPQKIVLDENHNVYVSGRYKGLTDFDIGPSKYELTGPSTYNLFTAKYKKWKLDWFDYSSAHQLSLSDFKIDRESNLFKAFVANTANAQDVILYKLDTLGNKIWSKGFGGSGNDRIFAIKPLINGNLYAVGTFEENCDFAPGPDTTWRKSKGKTDGFLMKLGGCKPYFKEENVSAC
ncbi:MAG: SBBP repeat-containing protein, partial [Bacteroidetes bacterium]|nr:SBBP repeat-containing protein [Bacteroidota bacterium]